MGNTVILNQGLVFPRLCSGGREELCVIVFLTPSAPSRLFNPFSTVTSFKPLQYHHIPLTPFNTVTYF